ncbi:hypothetical protein ACD591_18445 [Rufibacter glacialis]|uniref:Uncharacterized protein n=1 Tax=Rufibacter glacialis TaxID=1259555 RepID=A0A5M8QT20_9BACT|nr:hypothetical protein [Rufibacter glacialis]KAA6438190.1 hypothetical protein FOE74_00705 [Rufibacter glacialis]GGK89368.1 hypothetical protein GCM10011405_41400 [Rufibacter glacialis]
MKIPAIKKLVETQTIEALREAEEQLINEETPAFEIEGADEGEQLTHVFGAIWILNHMQDHNADFKTALREFTQKVRVSIS